MSLYARIPSDSLIFVGMIFGHQELSNHYVTMQIREVTRHTLASKKKTKRQLVCNSFHGKTYQNIAKKRRASRILSDLWACKKLPSLEARKLFGSEGLSSSSVVKIWVESSFLNPTNTWTCAISTKNEMNKPCALDSWMHNTRGQEMQQPSLQCMTRES